MRSTVFFSLHRFRLIYYRFSFTWLASSTSQVLVVYSLFLCSMYRLTVHLSSLKWVCVLLFLRCFFSYFTFICFPGLYFVVRTHLPLFLLYTCMCIPLAVKYSPYKIYILNTMTLELGYIEYWHRKHNTNVYG